jgi:hypothetical protein
MTMTYQINEQPGFGWTDGDFAWHHNCVEVDEDDVEIHAVWSEEEALGLTCDTCGDPILWD